MAPPRRVTMAEPRDSGKDTPPSLRRQAPLDIRSLSLSILAGLAVVFTLQLGQGLFIPLVLSILISYALGPIVEWCSRLKIPRGLSAGVLLVVLVSVVSGLGYFLRDDATTILDQIPTAAQNLRERLREDHATGSGTLQKVQEAAKELEKAAAAAAGGKAQPRAPTAGATLDLGHYLWWGSVSALAFAGQVILILFLVYFILASGDLYKRKLVKIAGPTLAAKRLTVEILDDINRQIERFLFVQLFTSVIAAVLTWSAFSWVGLEHAGVWGVAAGLGNFIPYIGPLVIAVLVTIVGFLQFGTLAMAAIIAVISLAIKAFVGFVMTPWLMSRAAKMNPVAVFVGLLFWGWIWGVWGMLLSMPMIMVIKVVCDHIQEFQEMGELLGK